jgi:two-component system, OmpR family, response regulator
MVMNRAKLSVLVVDDNRDAADVEALLLSHIGCQVRVAYSGEDAIRAARADPPDVVLCDIAMPRMDGYAVARGLRADPATAGAKLVAFTAFSAEPHVQRIKEAGFDYHLVKGAVDHTEVERLLHMIKEIKELAEATKQIAEQTADLTGQTKELLQEAKAEFLETKEEIREVKGELKEVKEELQEVKDDLKETKRALGEGG